jgi:4-diphosphocytidyl-2-C-methyl-D-erythritol kinase
VSRSLEETAFAKINLALHVRAREPDGYHRLETLFAFAGDGDRLRVEPGEGLTLRAEGPFAGGLPLGDDNLVIKAARALREAFGISAGAALVLDKRLPVASGIGGGSADAAAALRLLPRWWGIEADPASLHAIAASLGADVPACLASVTARGEGRGDQLHPIAGDALQGMPLLLVNPRVPVSTAAVFAAWDGVDRGTLPPGAPLDAACAGRNDLEPPARRLAPVIGEVLERLAAMDGIVLARMSGSGATCFALFESDAAREAAHASILRTNPGWWQLSTRLK